MEMKLILAVLLMTTIQVVAHFASRAKRPVDRDDVQGLKPR